MWLAQLWLNAIFEKYMESDDPPRTGVIEGVRLAGLRPSFTINNTQSGNFWSVFRKFLNAKTIANEEFDFMPFAERHRQTNWYCSIRFAVNHEKEQVQRLSDARWAEFTCAQILPVGFPQYKKVKFTFKARLHATSLMARQMGFAQGIPEPNEGNCLTRSFYSWWNAYYRNIARPYDVIRAGADKLLLEDPRKVAKPVSKRKSESTTTSKRNTKVQSYLILCITYDLPILITNRPSQEKTENSHSKKSSPSSADSHSEASSSPKRSKEKSPERPPEKIKPNSEKSKGTQEKLSSPSLSSRSASIDHVSIELQHVDPKQDHVSDKQTQKSRKLTPGSPSHSSASRHSDSDLNVENLILEPRKATSATIVKSKGHSDSANKSVNRVAVDKTIEQPNPEKTDSMAKTPKLRLSSECTQSFQWLIELLNQPIPISTSMDEVEEKTKVVIDYMANQCFPEEDIAPLKAVSGLVKNLRNGRGNIDKCETRLVELEKDTKLLRKSETEFKEARVKLNAETQTAIDKFLALRQHKAQLEVELTKVKQEVADAESQEKVLQAPLDQSKKTISKIDVKLSKIATDIAQKAESSKDIKQALKEEKELYETFLSQQRDSRQALEYILGEYLSH
ncbi:hypothetical protein PIB30_032470 [Stylosanthes scabra]|uniref:Aminotransferase-like plant mobile domain-containing protein n=1 Tax=Stylosanthes scabra TaxID=79078 RepID=A0ABU6TCE1_9FABA|nr:hypothetical protein [Stylosanthes scabra]